MDAMGYSDPFHLRDIVRGYDLNRDVSIIDFGCGTGKVGQVLKADGYTNIHGVDATPEMMAVAKRVEAYQTLQKYFLGVDEFPREMEHQHDLATCCTCLLPGHFPPEAFSIMRKALKPGRLMMFSIRDLFWTDESDLQYKQHMEKMVKDRQM